MARTAKIGISLYLLFVLYSVFNSQVNKASGVYTPDPGEPAILRDINIVAPNKLPAKWSELAYSPAFYRDRLNQRTTALIALTAGVPEALEKADRLAARQSVAPIDGFLFSLNLMTEKAHDRGNFKVRNKPMGARGVAIYASNRGSGSSSHK